MDNKNQLGENWKSEDQLQAACFQWHWNTFQHRRRTLFHVQQKARNAIEGARFKAIGVVKGPSDLIMVCPGGVTLYIEMKLPGERQMPEQKDFEARVKSLGHIYVICNSLKQFKEITYHYGKPEI